MATQQGDPQTQQKISDALQGWLEGDSDKTLGSLVSRVSWLRNVGLVTGNKGGRARQQPRPSHAVSLRKHDHG